MTEEAHFAAHQLSQRPRDHKPQTRAAIVAGRRTVPLPEPLEQGGLRLHRNPDAGVFDFKADAPAPVLVLGDGDTNLHPTGRRELHGVADEIEQSLAQAHGIHLNPAVGHRCPDIQPQALGLRLGPQQPHHTLQGVDDVDRFGAQFQAPGLDLGEVHDVIEQLRQHAPAQRRLVQQPPALSRQVFLGEQLQHPHDPVHGGADLVAHVGQEFSLGLGARLGLFLGDDQRLLLVLVGVDIQRQTDDLLHPAGGVAVQQRPPVDPARVARRQDDTGLHLAVFGGGLAGFDERPTRMLGVLGMAHGQGCAVCGLFEGQPAADQADELRRTPEGALGVVGLEQGGAGRVQGQVETFVALALDAEPIDHDQEDGHSRDRQHRDHGVGGQLEGVDVAKLLAGQELRIRSGDPYLPAALRVGDVHRRKGGIELRRIRLISREPGQRGAVGDALVGGGLEPVDGIDQGVVVVGQIGRQRFGPYDRGHGAAKPAIGSVERRRQHDPGPVLIESGVGVDGVVAGDDLRTGHHRPVEVVHIEHARRMGLQPRHLVTQSSVFVDLDLFEFHRSGAGQGAHFVRLGLRAGDQVVEHDDRLLPLAGDRIDLVRVEVSRNDIDFRYVDVSPQVLVEFADQRARVEAKVTRVPIDVAHAVEQADSAQALVGVIQGGFDIVGRGARVRGGLSAVMLKRRLIAPADHEVDGQDQAHRHDQDRQQPASRSDQPRSRRHRRLRQVPPRRTSERPGEMSGVNSNAAELDQGKQA